MLPSPSAGIPPVPTPTSSGAPAGTKRPAASDLQRSAGSAAATGGSGTSSAQSPSSKRHAARASTSSTVSTSAAAAATTAAPTFPPSQQQMPLPQPLPAGPPVIAEEQLMGRTPEQLIQTILQIQASHQQYVASISQQYDNISHQLNELRNSLAAFYNGQAASHQAAASQLQLFTDPNGSVRLTRPGLAPSALLPPAPIGAPRGATTAPHPPNSRSHKPGPTSPQQTHGDSRLLPKAPSTSMQQTPQTPGPPTYDYRTVGTVEEVWKEYREGMDGQPAIEELDATWGSRWRPEPRGRTWYSRRKVIWDKIKEYIAEGMDEDEAVKEVEKLRDGGTINKLIRTLQDERKEKGGVDDGMGA